MDITDLTDKQLGTMISHYRSRGVIDGGRWTLRELLLEERKRTETNFPPREVAKAIISLSSRSRDGLVSYLEIWKTFIPDKDWVGDNSRRIVADALYRTIGYCVENDLPILTVLVVRKNERRLSPKAIKNIYEECRDFGLDVGLDPEAFVGQEREKALQLTAEQLPD